MSLSNLSPESIAKIYGSLGLDISTIVKLRRTTYKMDKIARDNDFHRAEVHHMEIKYVDMVDGEKELQVGVTLRRTKEDWERHWENYVRLTVKEQSDGGKFDQVFSLIFEDFFQVGYQTDHKLLDEVFESVKSVVKLTILPGGDFDVDQEYFSMLLMYSNEIMNLKKLVINDTLLHMEENTFINFMAHTKITSLRLNCSFGFGILSDNTLNNLSVIVLHNADNTILACPDMTDNVLEHWLVNPPVALALSNIITDITVHGLHNFVKRLVHHPRAPKLNYGFANMREDEQNLADLVDFQKERGFKWVHSDWSTSFTLRHTQTSLKIDFTLLDDAN